MFVIAAMLMFLSLSAPFQQEDAKKAGQEERLDYFKKWLEEDVKYIITDEERDVFNQLSTPEEKESFIEQFWFRRDTNPATAANEFKTEHYRRIAYVNERFQSGKPGWMTDRGRVYIIHGEPEYTERYPSGGPYARKHSEGGGSTYTYPFEIWHYRHLDGIGDNVDLEFVDPSFSGEYRLALRPEEKDMLLYVSGTAPTIREVLGRESGRIDRPYFNPGLENNSKWRGLHGYRAEDAPFARYARFAQAQKAPEIKFKDLREMVTTNVTFQNFPFEMRSDFLRLNEKQVMAPITIQVQNREMTFQSSNGVSTARANIYGLVRNMIGRIEAEFEDTVVAEYTNADIERGRLQLSVYQKLLVLEAGKRYRIDVVVRDQYSKRSGFLQGGLDVPSFAAANSLSTGSLILTRFIEPAPEGSDVNDRFVLGDVKIIPNVGNTFQGDGWVGAYLQVYGAELDQSTLAPSLRVTYSILDGKKVLGEFVDGDGESVQYYSPQRLVLLRRMPLNGLEPGRYQVRVEIEDRIGQRKTTVDGRFTVTEDGTPDS